MMPRSKNPVVNLIENVFAYGLMGTIGISLFYVLIVKPILALFNINID